MFKIDIDDKKNILTIKFAGQVTSENACKLCEVLALLIVQLRTNFTLVTDLSGLERMDLEAHAGIDNIMELCSQHGVYKVIRIIPDQFHDIGFNIMALFHYPSSVHSHTCRSWEEAEENFLKV